jgi:hypothetical protein
MDRRTSGVGGSLGVGGHASAGSFLDSAIFEVLSVPQGVLTAMGDRGIETNYLLEAEVK